MVLGHHPGLLPVLIMNQGRCHYSGVWSLACGVCIYRITKMLIEQDGPGWREKLPEIPIVPLAVQQQHSQKPLSAEVAEARAARAAQEEGR